MKRIGLFVSVALAVACGAAQAQDTFPGGIVYGPKAAFKIAAPEGWVLDNEAGVEQGLPCVLYPKGSSLGGGQDDHVRQDRRHRLYRGR